MKALLLAAGVGTRLRPITNTIPKCLVPINGKPLLEYWLDNLSRVGVDDFIVNTHYLSKQVEEFVKSSKYKDKITLVYENELLQTGGTILQNEKLLQKSSHDSSFMVVHADNLSFCDFKAFINAHKNRPKKCEITMMTFTTDDPTNCGIISKNEQGIVTAFYEKVKNPPTNLANSAVYIMELSIFKYLKSLQQKSIDISTQIIPNYLHKISTYHNDIYHRDIGTIKSYALAQIEIKDFIK